MLRRWVSSRHEPVDQVNPVFGGRRSGHVETFPEIAGRIHGDRFVAVDDGGGRAIIERSKTAFQGHLRRVGPLTVSEAQYSTVWAGGDAL